MRPTVAERTADRKLLLAAATLNGIIPLINSHTPTDMIVFVKAPSDEVHPELTEGMADAREWPTQSAASTRLQSRKAKPSTGRRLRRSSSLRSS